METGIEDGQKMTIDELARSGRTRLAPEYGSREAAAMVRLIFTSLKGWNATQLIANGEMTASPWLREKFDSVISRLMRGEPLQYILGEAYFYGMDLKVTPAVLIPRPETAELVDMIVDGNKKSDLRVLDIGTGSGAIAIALARNLPFAQVTGIDISTAALEVAAENVRKLHARVDLKQEDVFLYNPSPESFDIIVSNPPYIAESERRSMHRNVLEHEPESALFVPDDKPLLYYTRISEVGRRGLVPGGRLYLEINPLFADGVRKTLEDDGYVNVRILQDSSRKNRFAYAEKADD